MHRPGLEAPCAHIHPLHFAGHDHSYPLEIGIPPPVGDVMRVAYPAPEHGALTTDLTSFGHIDHSSWLFLACKLSTFPFFRQVLTCTWNPLQSQRPCGTRDWQ